MSWKFRSRILPVYVTCSGIVANIYLGPIVQNLSEFYPFQRMAAARVPFSPQHLLSLPLGYAPFVGPMEWSYCYKAYMCIQISVREISRHTQRRVFSGIQRQLLLPLSLIVHNSCFTAIRDDSKRDGHLDLFAIDLLESDKITRVNFRET